MHAELARLNNAIVRLEWANAQNPEILGLARDWHSWWDGLGHVDGRDQGELAQVLRYYGLRYSAAYARATHQQGVPRPEELSLAHGSFVAPRIEVAAGDGMASSLDHRASPWTFPVGLALGACVAMGLVLALRRG